MAPVKITEKSYISLKLFIAVIPLAFFLAMIYQKAVATSERIDAYTDYLQKIDRRLSRIEGALGVKGTDGY